MFIQKAGGILLLLALFLTGCSEQTIEVEAVEDPNIETIKKYLEIEYNGPDEEAVQVRNEMFDATTASGKTGIERYTDYINDTFAAYVEEEEIQKMILTSLVFTYHYQADESGFTFNTDKIQIKQQDGIERNYDYKVDVTFEIDGEKDFATLTGFVTMSEDGKISGVRGISDSGFYQEMINISNVNVIMERSFGGFYRSSLVGPIIS